jgi:hypothetical protein
MENIFREYRTGGKYFLKFLRRSIMNAFASVPNCWLGAYIQLRIVIRVGPKIPNCPHTYIQSAQDRDIKQQIFVAHHLFIGDNYCMTQNRLASLGVIHPLTDKIFFCKVTMIPFQQDLFFCIVYLFVPIV